MNRAGRLSILVATALLTIAVIANAQQPKKIPLIGYLATGDPASEATRAEATRLALRERGYIEGQNIVIEYRYAEGKPDRHKGLAAELVHLKVDIILVSGGAAPTRAAKNATKTIPIVMVGQGIDPVEAGLVDSLAYPGGNVTGVTNLSRELGGKRLELLKEAVPNLSRVAVIYDPANVGSAAEVKKHLPVAARALRLTLQPWEVLATDDLDRVFATIGKQRPHGIYVLAGGIMTLNPQRTAAFALKSQLSSLGNKEFVEAGGLMSYVADQTDSYRRVAYFVDRILKGTKPTNLPVEQPTKFELIINLKTAKQIGVTVAPELLARASRLIK